MQRVSRLFFLAAVFAATLATSAEDHHRYAERAGKAAGVHKDVDLNYRLDLADLPYRVVDYTRQQPDAAFVAMRTDPIVFSMVTVEDLGFTLTPEHYSEIVHDAMQQRALGEATLSFSEPSNLGSRRVGKQSVHQMQFEGTVGKVPMRYVVSSVVDESRAYQVVTFGPKLDRKSILREANKVIDGFSLLATGKVEAASVDIKSVSERQSTTFGYSFQARAGLWFPWVDKDESFDSADVGALSSRGFGAIVSPVCWQSKPPSDEIVLAVLFEEIAGDDGIEKFQIKESVSKGGAKGNYLTGQRHIDGDEFTYKVWTVANDRCGYLLAGWYVGEQADGDRILGELWDDFDVSDMAGASKGHYQQPGQRERNAYMLNRIGLKYYAARAYRDAYRFFSAAADLHTEDEDYLTNSVQALSQLQAYQEAADWLAPRAANFSASQLVRSWDAWLAYQTNDAARSVELYQPLFAEGYRDDSDFSSYLDALAALDQWERLDSEFSTYTQGDATEDLLRQKGRLLKERGRFPEALAVINELIEGRAFNADNVYERLAILSAMNNPLEVLAGADILIQKGFGSLDSYYYKGEAEYELRSYQKARESFLKAQTYSPANSAVRSYLESIDHMLGEGDTSSISQEIAPVPLPGKLKSVFSQRSHGESPGDYGAYYVSRLTGFDFSGGESLSKSFYQKIHVLDSNGVAQFSTLEFEFNPSHENLFVNRLIVRDADGKEVAKGDPASYYLTKTEKGYEASTEKTVHLPVPGLSPGSVVEVVVTKSISVEKGSFPLEFAYLSSDRPVQFSAFFVSGKIDRLAYQSHGLDKPVKAGSSLVWQLSNAVAFRWEPLQPYFDQILPWVQVGTTDQSWEAAGSEYLAKISDKLAVDPIAERAARLVQGVLDRNRKIEILSAYVQEQIRYEAIEFGRRAYLPKSARSTLRDKYGDCKDHAVLLYSLLNSVDIEARLALVNLSQQVLPDLPNVDQFDHMIVAIPEEKGMRFIDSTDKDLRLGSLQPRHMGKNYALVLDEKSELVQMPAYASDLTGLKIERTIDLGAPETVKVAEFVRLSGYQAAALRGQLRSIETSDMHAALQRWLATRYPDAVLDDYFVENIFDSGFDLLVELNYSVPWKSKEVFEMPAFAESYYIEYERLQDRRFPFERDVPFSLASVTKIRPVNGQRLEAYSPRGNAGESRFGNWNRRISTTDDGVELSFEYNGGQGRYPSTDYSEFTDFQRKAVAALEQEFVLK